MIKIKTLTKGTAIIGRGEENNGAVIYAAAGNPAFPDDAPLFQTGNCERCDISLKSWSKAATCPICANQVWLT